MTEPDDSQARIPARGTPNDGLASVVQIDRRDDVAAVCGRVDSAPTFAVVIHAPDGNRQLATQLGMRRLVRHAEDSGRVIAIATGSRGLTSRARQVGVPVSRRPEKIRWDSGGKRVLWLGPSSLVLPTLGRYIQFAVLAVVVVAALAAAFTVGPSATITASPPVEELSTNVVLTAFPDLVNADVEALELPARQFSTVRTITLAGPATGLAQVPVGRAVTLVTLSNTGDETITIPEGARVFAAPDDVAFVIDQETDVPAGSAVLQQASAVEPGPGGNVAAGAITRWGDDRYADVQVVNAEAATGGALEERQAVSADDVAALQQTAATLTGSEALRFALVEDQPGVGVIVRTAVVEAEPGAPTPAIDAPGSVVLLEVEVTVTGWAVPVEALEDLAVAILGDEAAGTLVSGSVRAIDTGRVARDGDDEYTTEFRLTAGFSAVDEDDVRDAVKGRSPEDARSTLDERYDIGDAEVDLVPGFMPWLPRFDFRIDVAFEAPDPESAEPSQTPDADPTATVSPSPTETAGP